MVSAAILTDLADTLTALAAVPLPADAEPGTVVAAWSTVRAAARERFAPLNHVNSPGADRPGQLVTVAPQDDPQVRLQVAYDPPTLTARAEFANPVDGTWEPFYDGPLAEFDEATAARLENRITFIAEAWVRADELATETVLTPLQARIQALTERGYEIDEIATILSRDPETVEASLARIDGRIEEARITVELLG